MVLQPDQLASLEFLGDELHMESDGPRREDMARHLYMHAFYGHDLTAHVPRLLKLSAAKATTTFVGKALAVHAFNVDDGSLATTLLASPFQINVLQVDHRKRVGPASIAALLAFAAAATPPERQLAFRALDRLATFGADLRPGLALFCDALGTKPSGRGLTKIDLDAHARYALAKIDRATVIAELEQRTSKGARAFLAQLTAG